jgi:integrase
MGTKSKRANGEGSVYRRADGKWVGSVSIQVPNKGLKRKVFYGKSKTEVREKVLAALNEKQKGTLIVAEQQTLQAYLEQWLENSVKLTIRPRSYERYAEIVRLHIVPILGKMKLQALAPQHVQMLQAQKTQEGLSSTTVAAIHGVLHKALKDAVKLGLVARNVCDAIPPPRKHHKEISPLTVDQVRKLLEAAKGHPQEALFVLALATGMRRGELLGLKWQDINFTTGMLYVRRTLSRLPTQMGRERGDLYIEAEPKTKNSRRSIALARFALEALEQHRKRQEEMKDQAGGYWKDNDYVFCDEYGQHLDPGYGALVQLKLLLKKARLPDIRFHDLRHSAATLLLSMGVHPKIVQEMLGHSEISMTMDIYSHVLPTMQREAVSRLNQIFMEAPDSPDLAQNQLIDPRSAEPKEEKAL